MAVCNSVNCYNVFFVKINEVGYVNFKRSVSRKVSVNRNAVDKNLRMSCNALEVKCKAFCLVVLIKSKVLSVPCIFVLEKAEGIIVFFIVVLVKHVIVRERNVFPLLARMYRSRTKIVGTVVVRIGGRTVEHILGLCHHICRTLERGEFSLDFTAVKSPIIVKKYLFGHHDTSLHFNNISCTSIIE